jgi:AcrR family transcriptional regulator
VDSDTSQETPEFIAGLVARHAHGRVPRELRRRQILAVATELFIGRGFIGASMEEIARRAGVTKPVVYELVGSKEQLFHEVVMAEVARLAARVEAAVNAEPDQTLKLRCGTLAFFLFIGERRAAWRALMAMPEAPITAELAAARRIHARSVAALLARGASETGVEVDPLVLEATAHAINGATEALAHWWNDHPEVTPDALADLVTQLVAPGLLAFGT